MTPFVTFLSLPARFGVTTMSGLSRCTTIGACAFAALLSACNADAGRFADGAIDDSARTDSGTGRLVVSVLLYPEGDDCPTVVESRTSMFDGAKELRAKFVNLNATRTITAGTNVDLQYAPSIDVSLPWMTDFVRPRRAISSSRTT